MEELNKGNMKGIQSRAKTVHNSDSSHKYPQVDPWENSWVSDLRFTSTHTAKNLRVLMTHGKQIISCFITF
jgi:hypothetical protein